MSEKKKKEGTRVRDIKLGGRRFVILVRI